MKKGEIKESTPTAGNEPAETDEAPEPESESPGAEAEIEALKARHAEELKALKEKMLRVAADFENYKKRIQREIAEREDRIKADAIRQVLPTVENLHRAVEQSRGASDAGCILDGIVLVEKHFLETLEKIGIKRIEALGAVFDPALHEAVAQVDSKDVPAGIVLAELSSGYMLNGKLLQASKVVVSRGSPEADRAAEEPQPDEPDGNGDPDEPENEPQA